MNRQEWIVVAGLFALLVAWGLFYRPKAPADRPAPEPGSPTTAGGTAELAAPPATNRVAAVSTQVVARARAADEIRSQPETRVLLTNSVTAVSLSSWGAGIVSVELRDYRSERDPSSAPLVLDFSGRPSLSVEGVPGLSTNSDFGAVKASDREEVRLSRSVGGLEFERTVALSGDYRLHVVDRLRNAGATALDVPEQRVALGPMREIKSRADTGGVSYLGLDTLADEGGARVRHWGQKDLPSMFGYRPSMFSCGRAFTGGLPPSVTRRIETPVAWIAAKNKFFVNILAPRTAAADGAVAAERDVSVSNSLALSTVSAALVFPAKTLQPGEELTREYDGYIGPKKDALLERLGNRQDDVMEFGSLRWICKKVLWTLNALHTVVPNYGVAIILLTALVRLVFWPVTRKGSESMKRMQKIQPEVNLIRQKHKDNPQKMNQEVMALYKRHHVNPMMGCLPMVIQIPVFIALFTVLRSAIELRFAPFLWIRDLSEPEGLLAGVLPIPLNILPIFMTIATVWQQKLTPSGGDPQQQRMMMLMPVVMLFLFYNMAAALVLYWSVSQCLAMAPMVWQKIRKPAEPTGASTPSPSVPPPESRRRGKPGR